MTTAALYLERSVPAVAARFGWIVLVAAACAVTMVTSGCANMCSTIPQARADSPSGQYAAYSFLWDCGAMTGVRAGVAIVKPDQSVRNSKSVAFFERPSGLLREEGLAILQNISLRWYSDSELEIIYDQRAAVLRQKAKKGSVKITHRPAEFPTGRSVEYRFAGQAGVWSNLGVSAVREDGVLRDVGVFVEITGMQTDVDTVGFVASGGPRVLDDSVLALIQVVSGQLPVSFEFREYNRYVREATTLSAPQDFSPGATPYLAPTRPLLAYEVLGEEDSEHSSAEETAEFVLSELATRPHSQE